MTRYITAIALCLCSASVHAVEVTLQAMIKDVMPTTWEAQWLNNRMRLEQVGWISGQRWTETVDELGRRNAIAFVADGDKKQIYVSPSGAGLPSGLTLVSSGVLFWKDEYGIEAMSKVAYQKQTEHEAHKARLAEEQLSLKLAEDQIHSLIQRYRDQQQDFQQTVLDAADYGIDINAGEFVVDNTDVDLLRPVRLVMEDPRKRVNKVEPGVLRDSIQSYVKQRWGYAVTWKQDFREIPRLPSAVRLPGISLDDDLAILANALNGGNQHSEYRIVIHHQDEGPGGRVEVIASKKRTKQ